jgi:oligopeptide/dipeptide ABC transporter ATP-binding protein
MPLLQVTNLSKSFTLERGIFSQGASLKAVDSISFDLEEGECLAVVGESGCGKTTLCRMILRLLEPDSGEVIFEGEDFWKARGEKLKTLRRKIQPVFQDPFASLNPRFTMGGIIREGLIVHGITDKKEIERRLRQTLEEVGLSFNDARRHPHEFSGGQRQRISIARAIILQPKVIIADEPVSSLDVSVQAQILNLLYRMGKEHNLALLLIAHDLAMVRQISRRIIVMYRGRVMEEGMIEEVYDSPRHPYTRLLLESIPAPDAERKSTETKLEGFRNNYDMSTGCDKGCLFYNRCPKKETLCSLENPQPVRITSSHHVYCHFPG